MNRSVFHIFGFILIAWATHAGVPSGWGDVNVGLPGIAGVSSYTNGAWTVA